MTAAKQYVYHVTTIGRLPSIARYGLGGGPATFTNYAGYSKGRVFLTNSKGVDYWAERVWAHATSNDETSRNTVPVLLRIPTTAFDERKVTADVVGNSDAYGSRNWIYAGRVARNRVQYWTGTRWASLSKTLVTDRLYTRKLDRGLVEDYQDEYPFDEDDDRFYHIEPRRLGRKPFRRPGEQKLKPPRDTRRKAWELEIGRWLMEEQGRTPSMTLPSADAIYQTFQVTQVQAREIRAFVTGTGKPLHYDFYTVRMGIKAILER